MSAPESLARRAEDSDWTERAARVGFVAYGVVHLLIAWVALQLAFGSGGGEKASQKGALAELAQQPFGKVLVWAVAVGMVLLVGWRVVEATVGHTDEDGSDRVRKRVASGLKAVLYAVVAISAVQVAVGSGGSGGGGTDKATAKIMGLPLGPALVVVVGLAILAYGAWTAYQGLSDKHAEHLDAEGRSGDSGRAYLLLGKVGYVAKGIAIALVGGLFGYAGLTHDPHKSGGLDVALRQLLQQPFGVVLLVAVALGLACYGVFCFARARHLSS